MALCRLYFNYYSHITLFYTQLVGLYHTGGIQSIIHWLGNRAKQHTWSLQYSRACYARTEAPSSVFSLKIEVKDHINEIKEHLWHTNAVKVVNLSRQLVTMVASKFMI